MQKERIESLREDWLSPSFSQTMSEFLKTPSPTTMVCEISLQTPYGFEFKKNVILLTKEIKLKENMLLQNARSHLS